MSFDLCEESIQRNAKELAEVEVPKWVTKKEADVDASAIRSQAFLAAMAQVLPKKNTVYSWGDLHGDIGSFVLQLSALQSNRVLDVDYRLLNRFDYFVFCGDFVDRGVHGLEVLATILQLKKQNPRNVLILRGNHEDVLQNVPQKGTVSLTDELVKKFPRASEKQRDEVLQVLHRWYNTLPVVALLGAAQEDGTTSFVQYCHGGMELYDLTPLMMRAAASVFGKAVYEHIEAIDRLGFFVEKLCPDTTKSFVRYGVGGVGGGWFTSVEVEKVWYSLIDILGSDIHCASALEEDFQDVVDVLLKVDEDALTDEDPHDIYEMRKILAEDYLGDARICDLLKNPRATDCGFMWFDFQACPGTYIEETTYKPGRGLKIGSALANELIKLPQVQSKGKVALVGIVRGHQHTKDSIPQLFDKRNHGVYRIPFVQRPVLTSVSMGLYGCYPTLLRMMLKERNELHACTAIMFTEEPSKKSSDRMQKSSLCKHQPLLRWENDLSDRTLTFHRSIFAAPYATVSVSPRSQDAVKKKITEEGLFELEME